MPLRNYLHRHQRRASQHNVVMSLYRMYSDCIVCTEIQTGLRYVERSCRLDHECSGMMWSKCCVVYKDCSSVIVDAVVLVSNTEADRRYSAGFVGVCLLRYFYKRRPDIAHAILLRLLSWKIVFTQTLPTRQLKDLDVVEMAVMVSRVKCSSSYLSSCINDDDVVMYV